MSAAINLGRVGLVLKGDYSSAAQYKQLDVVSYNGGSYAAKQSVKGVTPGNTTYWQLLCAAVKSPVNLLDNAYFENPVNQRGMSAYAGAVYGVDRWKGMSRATLSVGIGGILLSNNNPSAGNCYIQQVIPSEKFGLTAAETADKYTLAINVDGIVYVGSGDRSAQLVVPHGQGNALFLYSDLSSAYIVRISLDANVEAPIAIKWVALYKGEYTALTLPQYQNNSYSAELIECQRYYLKLNYPQMWIGRIWASEAKVSFSIPIPAIMRANPAISGGSFSMWINGVSYTITNVSGALKGNMLQCSGDVSGSPPNKMVGLVEVNTSAMELNCEL